jgi:hypothetical protein
LVRSGNLDRARLVLFGARQVERQDAVVVFCPDAVGVDANRDCDRAVETAGRALAAVQAGLLCVVDRLGAGDADRVVLDLSSSDFLTPGSSATITKSSPLRKTLTGG